MKIRRQLFELSCWETYRQRQRRNLSGRADNGSLGHILWPM